jgi:predicted RNA-binding Zn-ribbon protein involved in translation (DUF1610 family)
MASFMDSGTKQAVVEALRQLAIPKMETDGCEWSMIDNDANLWKCSKCDEEWIFEFGGPDENNMHYCPNCGRKLKEE